MSASDCSTPSDAGSTTSDAVGDAGGELAPRVATYPPATPAVRHPAAMTATAALLISIVRSSIPAPEQGLCLRKRQNQAKKRPKRAVGGGLFWGLVLDW